VVTVINTQQIDKSIRIPSYDRKISGILDGASFLGVAFSPDSKTVYLSQGDKGKVVIFDLEKMAKKGSIDLDGEFNGVKYEDSFTSHLVLNAPKNELLVLDRGNFRMVRIDLATKRITASIKTGRQPFHIALSPKHDLALVANVGLYSYPTAPGVTPQNKDTMMLTFPPYGTFTQASIVGDTLPDGRVIPGLGDPRHPDAMSVFAIDLTLNRVAGIYKTGRQIGQFIEEAEIVGGASPNSIAVGQRYAYIANATNDLISVLDLETKKMAAEFPITVDGQLDKLRGLMPFGVAMNTDESRLYVALLGFNAVAVIDLKTRKTIGLIPTGWGPSQVALSPDGKNLYIASVRGLGAGPNGGKDFKRPVQGTYIGDIQLSTFQSVPVPDAATLATYTQQALSNTFETVTVIDDGANPLPPAPGIRKSPISSARRILRCWCQKK
jgi:YVTN family beta-propeller protein